MAKPGASEYRRGPNLRVLFFSDEQLAEMPSLERGGRPIGVTKPGVVKPCGAAGRDQGSQSCWHRSISLLPDGGSPLEWQGLECQLHK